jgi:methylenetetrahydrofolate reductase (NADPH)
VEKLKVGKGLETLAYFAGYGLGPGEICSVLDSYRALGIENLLVVRGDAPHLGEDFQPHPESFEHASDLLAFIKPRYDFCLGAAAYPEGHIECESMEKDLEYLKLKVDNGAEFIITNYCYAGGTFFDFLDRCIEIGIDAPVLPGVMPVYTIKMMESLAALCGAAITENLRNGLDALPEGEKVAVLEFGIEFAYEQCKELLKSGVPGVHIYTMDRSRTTTSIVSRLRSEGLL